MMKKCNFYPEFIDMVEVMNEIEIVVDYNIKKNLNREQIQKLTYDYINIQGFYGSVFETLVAKANLYMDKKLKGEK